MLRRLVGPLCFLALVHLSLTATPAEEEISISSGQQWFAENKDALLALHQLVLKQPAIRRVDPGLRLEFVPKYDDFDSDTEAAYRRIEEICNEMGINNIAVARVGAEPQGDLIGIRYLLESRGLLVSGGSFLSIEYIPDSYLQYLDPREFSVRALNWDDWYVVVYRDST